MVNLLNIYRINNFTELNFILIYSTPYNYFIILKIRFLILHR